jgi:hypothetical protein
MSSTKFAYKELPKFTPAFYRQWASVVKDAFAERDWNDYLITPVSVQTDPSSSKETEPTPFTADPSISARAKAFLSQSIDFKYQPSIESCTTAAEIWTVFLQRYGTKSREDELRLEAELLSLVKLSTETLDEFIEKFDNKISAIRAQQEPSQRWDDHKVNMHYLRSLEYSNIEDEDWKAFVTYLGTTWFTLSNDSLQANTRIYYTAHIAPYKRAAPTTERLYAINAYQPTAPIPYSMASQDQSTPNSGRGRGRGNDQRPSGRGGGGDGNRGGRGGNRDTPKDLPRDKNAWCTKCERSGHAEFYCYRKYKDSGSTASFTDWCAAQPVPSPPQYSAPTTSTTSPPAPSSKRPSKEHAHGLIVRACRCNTNTDPNTWIFDTACTEHMTDRPLFFSTYDAFETPIEVHGIGGLLNALGQGKVIMIDHNGNTHGLDNVWYVPGLGDSIISKYWTRHCGLITSLDKDENFVLTTPYSDFKVTTESVGKMSIFRNLKVAEYNPATTGTAKVITTAMTPKQGQLMHVRLAHPSADRLRLLGILYKPGNCQICVMAKQTLKPFPANTNPRVKRKLERIYSDLCYVSPESFGHIVCSCVIPFSSRKVETVLRVSPVYSPPPSVRKLMSLVPD